MSDESTVRDGLADVLHDQFVSWFPKMGPGGWGMHADAVLDYFREHGIVLGQRDTKVIGYDDDGNEIHRGSFVPLSDEEIG